jgi:hypothetical protein
MLFVLNPLILLLCKVKPLENGELPSKEGKGKGHKGEKGGRAEFTHYHVIDIRY